MTGQSDQAGNRGETVNSTVDESKGGFRKWLARLSPYIGPGIAVVAMGVAGFLLYRALRDHSAEDLLAAAWAVPRHRLVVAFLFAAASYLCLTGFDTLAVRYAGYDLPYRRMALASFVSVSLGHSIGFAALSSGTIRYRFYTRWGLSPMAVAKIVVFCGVTVALGLTLLAGIAFLVSPDVVTVLTAGSHITVRIIGAICLGLIAGYLAVAWFMRRPISIGQWRFEMPSPRLAIAQIVVGTVNFAFVAACLYQIVAASSQSGYLEVAAAYVLANLATIISHVPGGTGVIESAVIYLLPTSSLLGAVLLFRLIYFLVPLALGLAVFAIAELVLFQDRGQISDQPVRN